MVQFLASPTLGVPGRNTRANQGYPIACAHARKQRGHDEVQVIQLDGYFVKVLPGRTKNRPITEGPLAEQAPGP